MNELLGQRSVFSPVASNFCNLRSGTMQFTIAATIVADQDLNRILDKLVRLTADYAEKQDVSADTHFISDLALNSLKVMNLMADVEDHFDIEIPLEQLPQIRTVGDAAQSVMSLLASGAR